MKKIFLKDKKEKPVLNGHPWVFSGAIKTIDPDIDDGEIITLCDSGGNTLGCGYYNSKTPIAVRMLSSGDEKYSNDHLQRLIRSACERRIHDPLLENTGAVRMIFSEGDFLPGLIVDRYNNHLVTQYLTLGMDRLRDSVTEILIDLLKPESIYERSDHEGRILEGLAASSGQVWGVTPSDMVIREKDMSFYVDIIQGQKTGFFIDLRDLRALVKTVSRGREVLNLFCYTGGFTVAALMGGAKTVTSVDASEGALETARKNRELNNIDGPVDWVRADVFQYLRKGGIMGDFIICDPPALAKNRSSVEQACRGYKDLNLQIARKCPAQSMVLTCSCSRFIDMALFQKVVFSAFADAGRRASMAGKYHQPCDHPTSLFCPETEYLKALLLYVE